MAHGARRPRLSTVLVAALCGILAILIFLWAWALRHDQPAPATVVNGEPASDLTPSPARRAVAPPTPGTLPATADAAASAPDAVPPAPPIDAGEDGLRHPHPITARHVRIQRENNLLGALDGAMDVKDAAGMRRLLQQYRNEFPEDENQMQDGYRIITDCIEFPGPASRAAGQRYYDRERGSTLRRFVARHCLEP